MRESVKSGDRTIALYSKASGIPVYTDEEWHKNEGDALEYGKDYDFSRSFFEQFHEFSKIIPRTARSCGTGNIRCDYIANMDQSKDCYLVFNTTSDENCAYGCSTNNCKDSFDMNYTDYVEKSYYTLFSEKCFKTHFSEGCSDSSDLWFSKNCSGSMNCFGCVNLKNKSYCFLNEQLTKEEYSKRLEALRLDTWEGIQRAKELAHAFWKTQPVKFMNAFSNFNVSGEYIHYSKNVHDSYLIIGGENLAYCQYQLGPGAKDSMDITVWGTVNELCYETVTCGYGTNNVKFSAECWPGDKNLEYCMFMKNCSDCFGCFGLKNRQYCIFNKQYKKEEYEALRARIVEQMKEVPYYDKKGRIYTYGEFFPMEHSPFGYNTSALYEHFPLTKEEALKEGFPWDDPERKEYAPTLDASKLPESVTDTDDSVLNEILGCLKCKKAYRIIASELKFLRDENIALPRHCIECRHQERIARRRKPLSYERTCMCNGDTSSLHAREHNHTGPCPKAFKTSYAPENPETVYCESCFQKEVN